MEIIESSQDDYESGRQRKQAYLVKNVVEVGYDTTAFV